MNNNQLINLPTSFGKLTKLEKLYIASQKIQITDTYIDKDIANAFPGHGKTEIFSERLISPNQLLSLPESFGGLSSLKELDLRDNQLKTLPDSFKNLNSLEILNLHHNNLKQLPSSLGYLKNLMKLDLDGNPYEGESKKFLERYDERDKRTFERYMKKRDIPMILKFCRKMDQEEKEKIKKEEFKKDQEKIIAYLKGLPKIYEEISFNKLISKTGLERDVLEIKLEDMIINKEIKAKIKGENVIFKEKRPLILSKPEYFVDRGFNIFISYSTLDSEYFQIPKIAIELEEHSDIGKAYYWEEYSGENIVDFMERTLRRSKIFILFCSENAIKSQSVEDEWQAAFQLRKRGKMKTVPVYKNEDYIPRLLWPLINVKFNREDFISFMEKLFKEIFRK